MPDGNGGMTLARIIENGAGYLWFLLLAVWGGTVNYINRVKKTGLPFSIVELIGEWAISGFVGIVTIYVCMSMKMGYYETGAIVGIAGHMGGRAIFIMEKWMQDKLYWIPKNGESKYSEDDKGGRYDDERRE